MWSYLLRDPKLYAALLFLIETVLFIARPDFPPELWVALTGLLTVVFGALTVKTAVAEKTRRLRAAK